MEIRYIPEGTMTERQQKDVDIINDICLSGDSDGNEEEFDINTYEYSAPEDGMYLLFDGDKAVGRAAVHPYQKTR